MIFLIDDFEIDDEKFEVHFQGEARHIEPLVFDLLLFFCKNPDRVISRDEIIDAVWQGRFISDATLSSAIKAVRKTLDDNGTDQKYLRTIRGRGFEFIEPQTFQAAPIPPANIITTPQTAPCLMILPFMSFDQQPTSSAITDGLVENLLTVLTRVPLLSLVSRSSSFSLKGQNITAAQVHQDFKANYMLEGSIQATDDNVMLNIQLIDTQRDQHLWAQKFEQTNSPTIITDLLETILPRLEPQILRAMAKDLSLVEAQTDQKLLLKAMCLLNLKGWHSSTFSEAADLLRKSLNLNPQNALAHAYLALILGLGQRVGLVDHTEDIIQETISEADQALVLDDMDSNVLGLAGCALADIREIDRALPILRKAIDINPNNAQALAALGSALLLNKDPDGAIENLEQGIKISPADNRIAVWGAFLSAAYMHKGQFDQALKCAENARQYDDKNYMPPMAMTAVYMLLGKLEQAARSLKEAYRIKPDLSDPQIKAMMGRKLSEMLDLLPK